MPPLDVNTVLSLRVAQFAGFTWVLPLGQSRADKNLGQLTERESKSRAYTFPLHKKRPDLSGVHVEKGLYMHGATCKPINRVLLF